MEMPHARWRVALAILSAVILVLWAVEQLMKAGFLPQVAWVAYPLAALVVTLTLLWLLAVGLEHMKARKSLQRP
jgi:hypothetical protein